MVKDRVFLILYTQSPSQSDTDTALMDDGWTDGRSDRQTADGIWVAVGGWMDGWWIAKIHWPQAA